MSSPQTPSEREHSGPLRPETVICRCEEVTEEEIIAAYQAGYQTVEEIKRKLRCGMGPCQGRTCSQLVLAILSRLSGKSLTELAPALQRPPLKPTPLGEFRQLQADKEGGGEPR